VVFGGIQKVTLLDYPDKTACTLFTIGCNFRCPFCQNSSLVEPEKSGDAAGEAQRIKASEIIDFLKKRQGLLEGVCISGGEPLLQDGLYDFIKDVKGMGFLVKLDTNGGEPEKLKEIITSGTIDYIAMDIKNTPEKYAETIGVPEYDASKIKESVNILLSSEVQYEFRTTVVRELHCTEDILNIAKWISAADRYFLQGFINFDGVMQKGLSGYSNEEMQELLRNVKKIQPAAELRGV